MNTDFIVLIEFLDRLGPEVTGRIMAQPYTTAAIQLERFARGECDEDERHEVCTMLKLHPAWVRWLADRVKLARALSDQEFDRIQGFEI